MSETSSSPDISFGSNESLISINLFDSLVFERIIENIGLITSSNLLNTSPVGKFLFNLNTTPTAGAKANGTAVESFSGK